MIVYDERVRKSWSERSRNNDPTLDIEAEAAVIDKQILMDAEAQYKSIEVSCMHVLSNVSLVVALVKGDAAPRAAEGGRGQEA